MYFPVVKVMLTAGLNRVGSNGLRVAGSGLMQGLKPRKILAGIVRARAKSIAPQREEPREGMISVVSAPDIPAGDFQGEGHQEVDSGAMDGDPPEAAVSEVPPALAVGHR